jgi:glycosyltransferase involved in cell wall biosynthesis
MKKIDTLNKVKIANQDSAKTLYKGSQTKKIYYAGDMLSDNGPAVVNRKYQQHLLNDAYFCNTNSKVIRVLHFLSKLFATKYIIISSVSSFHKYLILIANKLNIQTYYLMHGFIRIETAINHDYDKHLIAVEKSILENCTKVVCVSENFSQFLKNNIPDISRKVTYVNNGVDSTSAQLVKSLCTRKFRIVSVGGGMPRKNNLIVCEAIARLNNPNISFCVIGPKHRDGDAISKYNFVDYHESLSHSEVLSMICNADLYIQNSSFETFGLAVCEAITQRTNILVSSNVGAISVLKGYNEKNIINNYKSVSEVCQKIKYLQANNAKRIPGFRLNSDWSNSTVRLLKIIYDENNSNILKKLGV